MPTMQEMTPAQRDALTVRHLEDAARAIEAALRAMPNDRESGFTGSDARQLSEIHRGLGMLRAQTEPADPIAVMVPVGILEQAGALADQLTDAAEADADAASVCPANAGDLARGLYAAARGENVDWHAVTARA